MEKQKLSKNKNLNLSNEKKEGEMEVTVMYQRVGTKWFAFTEVNEEVFFSPIHEDELFHQGKTTIDPSKNKKPKA